MSIMKVNVARFHKVRMRWVHWFRIELQARNVEDAKAEMVEIMARFENDENVMFELEEYPQTVIRHKI